MLFREQGRAVIQERRQRRPHFLIVAQDRAMLLPLLLDHLGSRSDLHIILDRRRGDGRRAATPVALDRRQNDRRRGMARGPLRP